MMLPLPTKGSCRISIISLGRHIQSRVLMDLKRSIGTVQPASRLIIRDVVSRLTIPKLNNSE